MLTRIKHYLAKDYEEFQDSERFSARFMKNILQVFLFVLFAGLLLGGAVALLAGIILLVYSCEYFGMGLGLMIDIVSLTLLGTLGKTMYERFCS